MIAQLVALSRPRFWLYTAGPVIVGAASAMASPLVLIEPIVLVLFAWFLLPGNLFLYGINDLFDADTDAHNEKKGSREVLLASNRRRAVALAVIACVASGVVLGAWLVSTSHRVAFITAFLGGYLVLGAAYSAPPARLKARPFLDSASNVLYVVPGFLAYSLLSGQWPAGLLVAGAWCWASAMHLYSAIPDIEADAQAGLRTTAIVLGHRGSLLACALLWLVAAIAAWSVSPMLGVLAFAYVAIPLALLGAARSRVGWAYWFFPWINAVLGGVLFWWLALH